MILYLNVCPLPLPQKDTIIINTGDCYRDDYHEYQNQTYSNVSLSLDMYRTTIQSKDHTDHLCIFKIIYMTPIRILKNKLYKTTIYSI